MSEDDHTQSVLNSPGMLAVGLAACAEEVYQEPSWFRYMRRRHRYVLSHFMSALNPGARQEARVLRQLADALSEGGSLESALNDGRTRSLYLRSLVQAGMATGKLPAILDEYIRSSQLSRSAWRNYLIALFYPICLLGIAGIILVGFVVLIVPQFKEIFEDFGVELPFLSMAMISLSDTFMALWPALLVGVCVISVLLLFHRWLPFAALRTRWFYHVPLIGNAVQMAGAAEFCSRLAVLMECEIPLPEAMRALAPTLRDPHLAAVSNQLAHRFQNGFTPEDVSEHGYGLGYQLAGLFRWGHQPELFADGLRSSAAMFAAQVKVRLTQFGLIIEPIAIILVVLGAGFVMSGLFAPLIKLLNELS